MVVSPSINGMLLYLANNTRPDITFAVSQVARFTHSPRKSHAVAVEMILRYLRGTADKGLIVMPDGTYNLDTWVDSDFAVLYGREPGDNPNAARSRYGYITTCGALFKHSPSGICWFGQRSPSLDPCLRFGSRYS